MKIIEYGDRPEDKVYRNKCGHCKTVYEFARKEAKFHSDQRDGDYLTINCPVCQREAYVTS
jgi:hypothetical protein